MKIQYHKIALVAIIAAQVLFAQETDDEEEPELLPAIAAALPKPMSVAQALSGSGLPSGCTADFTSVFEKDDFDMAEFMKELPLAVAKVKLQLKSPFGKPQDSDRTDVGLSVGCIKALPESPVEIASLLKNISLKMGLDLAAETASVADNSIPANVAKEKSGSGGGVFGTVMFITMATGGLGTIVYGITQNSEVARYVGDKNGKAAVEAESRRNMSYGIGAGLLAGGLIFYIVF